MDLQVGLGLTQIPLNFYRVHFLKGFFLKHWELRHFLTLCLVILERVRAPGCKNIGVSQTIPTKWYNLIQISGLFWNRGTKNSHRWERHKQRWVCSIIPDITSDLLPMSTQSVNSGLGLFSAGWLTFWADCPALLEDCWSMKHPGAVLQLMMGQTVTGSQTWWTDRTTFIYFKPIHKVTYFVSDTTMFLSFRHNW